MHKTILLTGATDGIGLETARRLAEQGHRLLLHGRSAAKLEAARDEVAGMASEPVETYLADLSRLGEVARLAVAVKEAHRTLDVLINNAGVLRTPEPRTADGFDVRFAVNTFAPYLLTKALLQSMASGGRVVNVSSAAQAPVDLDALAGEVPIAEDMGAYAQSKLAITMWSGALGRSMEEKGVVVVAVNPGSLLGSKMVREGFGVAGGDIGIGADILCRAALSEEFAGAFGTYYDNDAKRFAPPHQDALDDEKTAALMAAMDAVLEPFAEDS